MAVGTITSTGLGSGLDIEALVTGLVEAERAPTENRINRNESQTTTLISAFGQLNSVLGSVQTAVSALANRDTFSQLSPSSSQYDKVIASADTSASPASYDVSVNVLAEAQSLASGGFAATNTVVGEGTLSIDIGTPTYSGGDPAYSGFAVTDTLPVTIAAGSTLEDVKNAINEQAGDFVEASIVQDGGQFRLLMVAKETGVENSLQVTVTDTGDGNNTDNVGLSQLAYNASVSNLSQTNAAVDASFSINGLALTSATNQVDDVIEGVSLTLLDTTDTPSRISITENRSAITGAINSFIEAYNGYVATMNRLTNYNSATDSAGALVGDFTARSIESAVRSAVSTPLSGASSFFDSLATVGVTTNTDGTLSFDSSKLTEALDSDKAAVIDLFAGTEDGGTDGIAQRLESTLTAILESDGVLDSRTDSLTERLDTFEDQRLALERRMAKVEERYRFQFNALDALVAQLTSTGDFLQQQLASLPYAQKSD